MKKTIIFIIIVVLLLSFTSVAFAHSGGTDSDGGHRDKNNTSGLGSYHYHHGYSAHLHENGICPYDVTEEENSERIAIQDSNTKDIYIYEDETLVEVYIADENITKTKEDIAFDLSVYANVTIFVISIITLIITAFFCNMYCIAKKIKAKGFVKYYILIAITSFLIYLHLNWINSNEFNFIIAFIVSSWALIDFISFGNHFGNYESEHAKVLHLIWDIVLIVTEIWHIVLLFMFI